MRKVLMSSIGVLSLGTGFLGAAAQTEIVFLNPPCGVEWLESGLQEALLAKSYVRDVNRVTAGTALRPDGLRPASLGDTPGDLMSMNHWILWFNDYLGSIKNFESLDGSNRIVVFHSCFEASAIESDGRNGNPFSSDRSLRNYQSVFRHPDGFGKTRSSGGTSYAALDDVFSRNADTLFVVVTPPPLRIADSNLKAAERARTFANWLKGEWLASYRQRFPRLGNVVVFDWFDILANPSSDSLRANLLKDYYHNPSEPALKLSQSAHVESTRQFAAGEQNVIDQAWAEFTKDFLYFPQVGGGELTSEIQINNPSADETVQGGIEFLGDDGSPLPLYLEGEEEPTASLSFEIVPLGGFVLKTREEGILQVGSALVTASGEVGGILRFSIPGLGIAGVGEGVPVDGFISTARNLEGIRTGIALTNVGGTAVSLDLTLRDLGSNTVAGGESHLADIPPGGHLARFLNELFPDADLQDFRGVLIVRAVGGKIAATALELGERPGEFTTAPVTPLIDDD